MGSDDFHKKRKNQRERSKVQRQQYLRVLILTEGCSEEKYFLCIVNAFKLSTVEVERCIHTDANSIVVRAVNLAQNASKKGSEYDYIFCVFDLDTVKNKVYMNNINSWNSKKNITKIFPIYTYPCIEVWFILHFEVCTAPFSRQGKKSVGDVTKSYLKANWVSQYSENDEKSIQTIASLYEIAIDNSQKLVEQQEICKTINPITTVYKLLIFLRSMRNSSNNCLFIRDIEDFIDGCLPI